MRDPPVVAGAEIDFERDGELGKPMGTIREVKQRLGDL